jgi:hypothetical protein
MSALLMSRQQQLASVALNAALAYTKNINKRAHDEKTQDEKTPEVEQTQQASQQMTTSPSVLSSKQKTATTQLSSSIEDVSKTSERAKTDELIDNVVSRSLSKDPLVQQSLTASPP